MKAPKCKICGAEHWSRQPCPARESGEGSSAVERRPSKPTVEGSTPSPRSKKSTAAPVSDPRKGEPVPGKGASRTVPQARHADNREAVTGQHRASGEIDSGATGGRQLQPALRTEVALGAVDTATQFTKRGTPRKRAQSKAEHLAPKKDTRKGDRHAPGYWAAYSKKRRLAAKEKL